MRKQQPPDLTETKAHIFIAGHELLKAAEGMLKFCKSYVEATSECHKHPYMVNLLNKGICIAKDLGTSMSKESFVRETTTKIIKGFCDTLEDEMRQESAKRPKPKQTKTVRNKKRVTKKIKREKA
ncbi:MAG: hypothetical protein ABH859_05935 [Pseudomonadota bacterium]